MKFNCEKAILLSALTVSGRAISTHSSIPLLDGLLIEADKVLCVSAYNMNIGIKTHIEADIHEGGRAVVPAKMLTDIVRKLPDDIVEIEVKQNNICHVSAGMSNFKIAGYEPEEYPEMPVPENGRRIKLPQKILKGMISKTIYAAIADNDKDIHSGMLFEFENDILTTVALDGFRMSLRREKISGESYDLSFVAPGVTLKEVSYILADDEEPVIITISDRLIVFETEKVTLFSNTLFGEFLKYRRSIPDINTLKLKATVNTREFLDCVERMGLMVNEKLRTFVKLTIGDDNISFVCSTSNGKATDLCHAEVEGEGKGEFEIGFNPRFLIDSVKNLLSEEKIILGFNTPISPCLALPLEGDAFLALALPMRLNNA